MAGPRGSRSEIQKQPKLAAHKSQGAVALICSQIFAEHDVFFKAPRFRNYCTVAFEGLEHERHVIAGIYEPLYRWLQDPLLLTQNAAKGSLDGNKLEPKLDAAFCRLRLVLLNLV